ncbi:flavoprotein [Suillus variegatus]|nr:flavoprotein [Suillus variegatus]
MAAPVMSTYFLSECGNYETAVKAAATISPSWEPAVLGTYSSSYHSFLKFKPVRDAVFSTDTRESHVKAQTHKVSPIQRNAVRSARRAVLDFLSHALVVIAPLPSLDASDVWWSQFMFIGATSLSCICTLIIAGLLQSVKVEVVTTKESLAFYDRADVVKMAGGRMRSHKIRDPILYIGLRRRADIVLVAPCSASTLSKVAHGLCDNLATSLLHALAPTTPTYIFTAMNMLMYEHPLTAEHVRIVRDVVRYQVVEPIAKNIVCGDVGLGAMTERCNVVKIVVVDQMKTSFVFPSHTVDQTRQLSFCHSTVLILLLNHWITGFPSQTSLNRLSFAPLPQCARSDIIFSSTSNQ